MELEVAIELIEIARAANLGRMAHGQAMSSAMSSSEISFGISFGSSSAAIAVCRVSAAAHVCAPASVRQAAPAAMWPRLRSTHVCLSVCLGPCVTEGRQSGRAGERGWRAIHAYPRHLPPFWKGMFKAQLAPA